MVNIITLVNILAAVDKDQNGTADKKRNFCNFISHEFMSPYCKI